MYSPTVLVFLGALTFSATTTSNALSTNIASVDHSTPRHDEGTRVLRANDTMTEKGEEERMVPYYNFLSTILEDEEEVVPVLSSSELSARLANAEAENKQHKGVIWNLLPAKEVTETLLRKTTVGKEVPKGSTPEELLNAVVADEISWLQFRNLLEQRKSLEQEADESLQRLDEVIRQKQLKEKPLAAEVHAILKDWGIDEAKLDLKVAWLTGVDTRPLRKLGPGKILRMALGSEYFERNFKEKEVVLGEGTSSAEEHIDRLITSNALLLDRFELNREVVTKWAKKIYDNEGTKLPLSAIVDMGIGKAFFDAKYE